MLALKDRQEVPAVERVGRVARLRSVIAHRVAVVSALVVGVIAGSAGAASATTSTDLTNGAGDTFFTSITGYFQDHVLISSLGLLALTVGAGMLIAWGRRAAHSR